MAAMNETAQFNNVAIEAPQADMLVMFMDDDLVVYAELDEIVISL